MVLKSGLLVVLFLLVFVGFANADINIYMDSGNSYNLNEDVGLSASLYLSEDLRGFLKSTINCDNYNMNYYIFPVNLVANDIESFDIPNLNLFEDMLGTCKIDVSLMDNSLGLVEKKSSAEFIVTDELVLILDLNKLEFLPGDKLSVNGEVNSINNQGVDEYVLDIYLDGDFLESLDEDSSKFKYSLELDENIKSNNHELKFYVEDSNGNKKEEFLEFFVNPVKNKLRNKINKLEFLPLEEVTIESLLYDQADELMYSDVFVRVYDEKGDLVLGKETNTEEVVSFTLDEYALPGYYKVITENEDFEIESEFSVLEVRNVDIYLENGELYIKNEGNIKFNDEIFVDLGEFSFFEDIYLSVSETRKILLVDDVFDGEYELTVTANDEIFELGLVSIQDDRSLIEKVTNKITGNIVLTNAGGALSSGLIWILVVLIVLIGAWYYLTFKRKGFKLKEIGIAEGKKTLDKIRTERAKNKFGVRKTSFTSRREEKKEDGHEGGLFSMFD